MIVRILSPGNDGPIVQSNGYSGGVSIALPASPASLSAGRSPSPGSPSVSLGADGITPPSHWTWIWNWGDAPASPGAVAGASDAGAAGGWTWIWNWSRPYAGGFPSMGAMEPSMAVAPSTATLGSIAFSRLAATAPGRSSTVRLHRLSTPLAFGTLAASGFWREVSRWAAPLATRRSPSVLAAVFASPAMRHRLTPRMPSYDITPGTPLEQPGSAFSATSAAVAPGSAPNGFFLGLAAIGGFLILVAPLGRRAHPRRTRRQRPRSSRLERPG